MAHFGLGAATAVEELTIVWPNGASLSILNPDIDQLHRIPHPDTGAAPPAAVGALEGDVDGDGLVSANSGITITLRDDGSPAANHAAKQRASSALLACVVLLYTAFGAR